MSIACPLVIHKTQIPLNDLIRPFPLARPTPPASRQPRHKDLARSRIAIQPRCKSAEQLSRTLISITSPSVRQAQNATAAIVPQFSDRTFPPVHADSCATPLGNETRRNPRGPWFVSSAAKHLSPKHYGTYSTITSIGRSSAES
jgi:hypothetical protein